MNASLDDQKFPFPNCLRGLTKVVGQLFVLLTARGHLMLHILLLRQVAVRAVAPTKACTGDSQGPLGPFAVVVIAGNSRPIRVVFAHFRSCTRSRALSVLHFRTEKLQQLLQLLQQLLLQLLMIHLIQQIR